MSIIKSSRGRDLLLLQNHSFSKEMELKSGEVYWRCTQRNLKCSAKVFTIGPDLTITRSELVHNHDEVDPQKLQRKMVTNACKRKAQEDISEKPAIIIRRAVAGAVGMQDFDALRVSDVATIRKNIYNCRRKLLPGPLPKNLAEVHDTARHQHLHPYNKPLKRSSSSSSSSKKDFSINLDVQQFSPEEITVKIVNYDTVMIECKHEEKEDEHGSISRHFIRRYEVPKGFDVMKCSSKLFNDGVLTITVPKLKNAVGKNEINIPIKFTNQPSEISEQAKVAEGENVEK